MQNTSAQLLFPIRLDSLKLARDSLKVVAGSPRDLLKILANGSPINTIVVLFLKGGGGWGLSSTQYYLPFVLTIVI